MAISKLYADLEEWRKTSSWRKGTDSETIAYAAHAVSLCGGAAPVTVGRLVDETWKHLDAVAQRDVESLADKILVAVTTYTDSIENKKRRVINLLKDWKTS